MGLPLGAAGGIRAGARMNDRTVSVLAVDDDLALLGVLSRVLTRAGYRCIMASSGAEALCRLGDAPVDVLITDLAMPGMGGLEFMHRARARDPDLPILIMTGNPG